MRHSGDRWSSGWRTTRPASGRVRTDSGGGGSNSRTGGGPGLTSMSTATSEKYRGLVDSAAVHSQWDGAGGGSNVVTPSSCVMAWSPRTCPRTVMAASPSFRSVTPLNCKKGGLVTARHNNLRDGVSDLAGKSFTPSHMRDNPLIYAGRAVKRTKAVPAGAGRTNNQSEVQPPEVTE